MDKSTQKQALKAANKAGESLEQLHQRLQAVLRKRLAENAKNNKPITNSH